MDPDCDFCLELLGHDDGNFQMIQGSSGRSRVVLEQGNIRVFPSLGELATGHLLVSPAYHVTSMLSLTEADIGDYETVVAKLVERMGSEGGPCFFEHGDPSGEEVSYGQCISHAHLHALSRRVDMLPRLKLERPYIGSGPLVSRGTTVKQAYLMFSSDGIIAHYFSAIDAPRQYLRKLYGELTGNPDGWKWFENIDLSRTQAAAERYRQILNQ